MAIRDNLSKKYSGWYSENKDTLERIFSDMSGKMTPEVKEKYRKAAREAPNMADEMYNIAKEIKLSESYDNIWKALPREARRKLSELYKAEWNTEEGKNLRKKLIEAATSANISKLYYYAAHGMYDQLAEELGIPSDKVPHNFAGAAKLVAAVRGIRDAYTNAWL